MKQFCDIYVYSGIPFGEESRNQMIEGINSRTGISALLQEQMSELYHSDSHKLQRFKLRIEDVIELNQSYFYDLNSGTTTKPQYVVYRVNISDSTFLVYRYYFYYVEATEWNAMNSVKLSLKMDVLNTYKARFDFSEKTFIERQFVDRFRSQATEFFSEDKAFKLWRRVDRANEGLDFPLVKNFGTRYIEDSSDVGGEYALAFRSKTDENGMDIYFARNESESITNSISSIILNHSMLWDISEEYGVYKGGSFIIYLTSYDNPNGTLIITDSSSQTHTFQLVTQMYPENFVAIEFYKRESPQTSKIHIRTYTGAGIIANDYDNARAVELRNTLFGRMDVKIGSLTHLPNDTEKTESEINAIPFTYALLSTIGTYTTSTINDLPRMDPQMMKIINVPYKPNYSVLDYNPSLKLMSLDTKEVLNGGGINHIVSDVANPLLKFTDVAFGVSSSDEFIHMNRNERFESKLYNSSFSYDKISYDTTSLIVALENYDASAIDISSQYLEFDYCPSFNLLSSFSFVFPQLQEDYSDKDFEHVLIGSRNNERMLLTNAYVEYLRNGYNYDIEMRKTNVKQGLTTSIIGGAAGWATMGLISGNPIVAGVGLSMSLGTSFINLAFEKTKWDASMAFKLKSLELQGSRVLSVSDYDLFRTYSKNKLRIDHYHLDDIAYAQVYNLFYYYGYSRNYYDLPIFNSRVWFDFVKCQPAWNPRTQGIPSDILSEITNKFKEGVTIFHEHNGEYDFAQHYENWENSLLQVVQHYLGE